MYYSGGIYSSASHQRQEWEPVDHAVLLVGYGSENGRCYGSCWWLIFGVFGEIIPGDFGPISAHWEIYLLNCYELWRVSSTSTPYVSTHTFRCSPASA